MPHDSLHPSQARSSRCSRSHLSKPLPPLPHEHVATSRTPGLSSSPASSSRPPSSLSALEASANTAATVTVPYATWQSDNFEPGLGDSLIDRAFGIVNSDIPQMSIDPVSATQYSAYFPAPSDAVQLPGSLYKNRGMFNRARNLTVTGTFVDGNVTYNNTSSSQFMKELLEKTISGAEFDSFDRDPPPRCHPGTRLAVLERCIYFIVNCDGVKKIRWVVGAAGVGKSAILQNVAESHELQGKYHASIFFSINGRSNGARAIITLAYQFAAKCEPYRQVIEQKITRDPSILRSSMSRQFNKLIVEPFIHNTEMKSVGRVLVVIDGLDECETTVTQQGLLCLIFDLCVMYPSSPLVWLIASRPETHITSFFTRRDVIPIYEKEEIVVDSEEARADVERFLRDKLTGIKDTLDSLNPRWPDERDIWKLANAAGGLFAYAQTVIRYVGDSTIRSPVSQLSDVLHVIDKRSMTDGSKLQHPMASLDALYDRILSNVPPKIMINTRKLLLALVYRKSSLAYTNPDGSFLVLCNWLGMTPDEAYASLNHLRSVLDVPLRKNAYQNLPKPFHKSFLDYIFEFTRSGFSRDIEQEAQQLESQCALRVLTQAPEGIDFGDVDYRFRFGTLSRGPGTGEKISLAWSVDEESGWNDDEARLWLYKMAMEQVVYGIRRGDPAFLNKFCIRLVTTLFLDYRDSFPHYRFRDCVFDESQRFEFMMSNILEQTPLSIIDKPDRYAEVKLQFRRPAAAVPSLADAWIATCSHEREGEWGEGKDQDWRTTFWETDCGCFDRFQNQLADLKDNSPDHTVVILFTSTEEHCVELRFVDPEDGVSEWTYWFWGGLLLEDDQKYVCPVKIYD